MDGINPKIKTRRPQQEGPYGRNIYRIPGAKPKPGATRYGDLAPGNRHRRRPGHETHKTYKA
ncbi:hypothetical protein TRIP_E20087 [uncultured Spirochaetota bacterium]|uniref:Uncharacterized protein n=1 Tax=uncultured Spirochaetota bacterium TaxID=460511 RepID=A0A652ZUT6_9SPIR|nr:hypothetical protein TRIP_E20087 [uncultured Spirochaetota bacterium]